jgi:DNA-binding GntR family transcriptional regulator
VTELRRIGAADLIAQILGDRMLSGELRQGAPLTETELAREFDVSRNTVREGLRLLTRDGLASHEVHRGVAVRSFQVDEVRQNYQIRAMIQREVGDCAGSMGPERATVLRQQIDRGVECRLTGDARGWMNHNLDFHLALVALLGNPRLDAWFTALIREIRIVLGALEREMDPCWDDGNVALANHLEAGDAHGYRIAVTAYLEHSCADVVRLMGQPSEKSDRDDRR